MTKVMVAMVCRFSTLPNRVLEKGKRSEGEGEGSQKEGEEMEREGERVRGKERVDSEEERWRVERG